MNDKIARFVRDVAPPTPYLVVDVDLVAENYRALAGAMPDTAIYYAMKANPAAPILERLAALGSCFDAASVAEIEMALATGCGPERLSYGNTIKKEADIARAHALGVRLFAFDAEAELLKIARQAPGARVFCRILTDGAGADWPLSRKFGSTPAMARALLLRAADLGLVPWGVSFHVGSQQRNPEAWDSAIREAAAIFTDLDMRGISLRLLNLGGGLPTAYCRPVPDERAYGQAITSAMRRHFGNRTPDTILEPGRALVGNAGVILSEVVLIAEKGEDQGMPWVYLDIGRFGGLAETMDEAIRYPITTSRRGPLRDCVLAGPTCDSADVLYERRGYPLPSDLEVGDLVEIGAAGAYTTTYASVAFNGFEPLRAYYL